MQFLMFSFNNDLVYVFSLHSVVVCPPSCPSKIIFGSILGHCLAPYLAIPNPLKTNFPSRIWTIKGLLRGSEQNIFPSFTKSIFVEKKRSEDGISSIKDDLYLLLVLLVILFLSWPLYFCPCRHGGIFWPIDWP